MHRAKRSNFTSKDRELPVRILTQHVDFGQRGPAVDFGFVAQSSEMRLQPLNELLLLIYQRQERKVVQIIEFRVTETDYPPSWFELA
jgi:hypothetical protein